LIDDEAAVEEMLSSFPSRELDEPVTKDFHRAESALLRAEFHHDMTQLRDGLRGEMTELRDGLRGEMTELRDGLRGEMTGLSAEMHAGFAELRIEMHRNSQRLTLTLAALMVSMTGVVVAALSVGG